MSDNNSEWERPSLPVRILRFPFVVLRGIFVGFPAWIVRTLRYFPPTLRYGFLSLFFLIVGFGSWYVFDHRMQERNKRRISVEWKRFEEEAGRLNTEKMEEALLKLEKWIPEDSRLQRRKAMMETLESDPGDRLMSFYCMVKSLQKGDRPSAEREAKKRIEVDENDWQARCLLAEVALRENNKPAAREHLKALPQLTQAKMLGPGGILMAITLHKAADADFKVLKEFLCLRLVQAIKGQEVSRIHFSDKLTLFKGYLQALEFVDEYPDLIQMWIPYTKLARALLKDPEVSSAALAEFSYLQINQLNILEELIQKKKFPEKEVKELREDQEERFRLTWELLRQKDAQNPLAYIGPAILLRYANKPTEALAEIDKGLEVCGDKLELIAAQVRLLSMYDKSAALDLIDRAVERLRNKSKDGKDDLNVLGIGIETANAANRPDKSLDYIRRALVLAPNSVPLRREQARLALDSGSTGEAIAALSPIADQLKGDDVAVRLYVQALHKAGATSTITDFLTSIANEARKPEPILSTLDIALKINLLDFVIEQSQKYTEKYPKDGRGWQFLGNAFFQKALPNDSRRKYDMEAAVQAIRAYERALVADPEAVESSHNLIFLQLKAFEKPDLANGNAGMLKRYESLKRLPPAYRATLGSLYVSLNQPNEARPILESVIESGVNRPVFWVYLGRNYASLGRKTEAWDCFKKAGSMPKEVWEAIELEKAVQFIQKGS